MSVDSAGFECDSGDTAVSQLGDEFTQSGRVCGELAGGVGAVGCGLDADPVTGIADINTGGVRVVDRQSRHLGRGHGFTPRLLDGWHGWRGVGR